MYAAITAIANRTPQYKCYKSTSQTTAVNKIDPLNSTEIYDTQRQTRRKERSAKYHLRSAQIINVRSSFNVMDATPALQSPAQRSSQASRHPITLASSIICLSFCSVSAACRPSITDWAHLMLLSPFTWSSRPRAASMMTLWFVTLGCGL